jgi:hypothetical protein
MSNHVKRKVIQNKTKWEEFIGGLKIRLAFHKQKANELQPLIEDLEKLRAEGMPLPVAQKKVAGMGSKAIPAHEG